MPESKGRVRARARSKHRDKASEARARDTQSMQTQAEGRKMTVASYRRRRILGWSLAGLAVVVFVQHLLTHMGFFTLISPGWDDLVAGYPLALLLAVGSAIVLSKT
ncbi:MAG: hypothetical protein ACRDIX_09210 [Actinomycetota bacterium]